MIAYAAASPWRAGDRVVYTAHVAVEKIAVARCDPARPCKRVQQQPTPFGVALTAACDAQAGGQVHIGVLIDIEVEGQPHIAQAVAAHKFAVPQPLNNRPDGPDVGGQLDIARAVCGAAQARNFAHSLNMAWQDLVHLASPYPASRKYGSAMRPILSVLV